MLCNQLALGTSYCAPCRAWLAIMMPISASREWSCQQLSLFCEISQVSVIEEGAASPLACLGLIRLVAHLAETWGTDDEDVTIIVDSGTGTTAIGRSLGTPAAQ